MAMEALGRVVNVVPIAAGVALSMKECGGIAFVVTGSDTFTFTVSDSYGGSYTSPGTVIDHWYKSTSTAGAALWTKVAITAADAVATGGAYAGVIHFHNVFLPDPDCYVKLTASGSGLVTAIMYDLNYQRDPVRLTIPAA